MHNHPFKSYRCIQRADLFTRSVKAPIKLQFIWITFVTNDSIDFSTIVLSQWQFTYKIHGLVWFNVSIEMICGCWVHSKEFTDRNHEWPGTMQIQGNTAGRFVIYLDCKTHSFVYLYIWEQKALVSKQHGFESKITNPPNSFFLDWLQSILGSSLKIQ